MKHRVAGRKLGRTSAHRLAVLRNLSTDLFRHERIRTTLMKAKELRPFAERLITAGKAGDVHARRQVARHIHDGIVARKLVETLSTRFAERPGGYTRIIKLGPRRGDSAEMAIVELIGSEPSFETKEVEDKKDRGRLGKIRERFSRRKSAPAEAAEEGGEEAPAKKTKAPKAPKAEKAAKAAKTPAAKAAKPKSASSKPSGKGGGKAAGGKRGGQTPKKGG
jgi:large subunit ribosomal protein L17